ncbi:MAG: hypothetical protein KKH94_08275 [Candidatus Omnitrophica bacterium]|nr:hypothetical protein [Candidatus Omnitrophota bacterium]
MTHTTGKQKIFLIIFGIVLFFLLLEVGLRFGGFLFSWMQEYRNKTSIQKYGEYRILCIGESTTAMGGEDSYPSQLEEILNKALPGIAVSVVNEGVGSASMQVLVGRLEDNIQTYKPHLIVTMAGINDIMYGNRSFLRPAFLHHFHIIKLIQLLKLHSIQKFQLLQGGGGSTRSFALPQRNVQLPQTLEELFQEQIKKYSPEEQQLLREGRQLWNERRIDAARELFEKVQAVNPKNEWALLMLGFCSFEMNDNLSAKKFFSNVRTLNPKNDLAYLGLGFCFVKEADFYAAKRMFQKAVALQPQHELFDIAWGYCLSKKGQIQEAEKALYRALTINPRSSMAYVLLSSCYRSRNKFVQCESMVKKALAFNPRSDRAYVEFGLYYCKMGDFDRALEMFKKAYTLNPYNQFSVRCIGDCYQASGNSKAAEKTFKEALTIANDSMQKAERQRVGGMMAFFYIAQEQYSEFRQLYEDQINKDPYNSWAHRGLGLYYYLMEDETTAQTSFQRAEQVESTLFDSRLSRYYRQLNDIAKKHGIPLVCVQYPVRNIKPLKQFCSFDDTIVFVDNELTFKTSVRNEGYTEYFTDSFAGDFGHCTRKGNRLLAKNIAQVLLREYFGQNIQQ